MNDKQKTDAIKTLQAEFDKLPNKNEYNFIAAICTKLLLTDSKATEAINKVTDDFIELVFSGLQK